MPIQTAPESSHIFKPKALAIGTMTVDPPVILAPMAGVTDGPYRRIMARFGAGLVTTEMVSAEGLRRKQRVSWSMCSRDPDLAAPQAVQIFGGDAGVVSEAAALLEQQGASLIDINAGCPVKKVIRQGAGAALLKDLNRLGSIVERTRKAVRTPLTVKIRLGWSRESVNVLDTARMLESAGADAISVHARTASQHYEGQADWSWIARVKEEVSIPVIGNGDVTSPTLAERMIRETGCDGVMIGRASLGNPWLFSVIASRWQCRPQWDAPPGWEDYYGTVCAHMEEFRRRKPKCTGHLRMMLIWYSKGCPDAAKLRSGLMELDRPEKMFDAFRAWLDTVVARGVDFLRMKVPDAYASSAD